MLSTIAKGCLMRERSLVTMFIPSPTRYLFFYIYIPKRRGWGNKKEKQEVKSWVVDTYHIPDRLLETQVMGAMCGILFELSAFVCHSPQRLHGAVPFGRVIEWWAWNGMQWSSYLTAQTAPRKSMAHLLGVMAKTFWESDTIQLPHSHESAWTVDLVALSQQVSQRRGGSCLLEETKDFSWRLELRDFFPSKKERGNKYGRKL